MYVRTNYMCLLTSTPVTQNWIVSLIWNSRWKVPNDLFLGMLDFFRFDNVLSMTETKCYFLTVFLPVILLYSVVPIVSNPERTSFNICIAMGYKYIEQGEITSLLQQNQHRQHLKIINSPCLVWKPLWSIFSKWHRHVLSLFLGAIKTFCNLHTYLYNKLALLSPGFIQVYAGFWIDLSMETLTYTLGVYKWNKNCFKMSF